MRISDWSSDVCTSDLTPGPTCDSRPPRGNWADPVTERSRQVHDRHRITDCPAASATAEFAHDRYRYRRRKPARPDAPQPAHRLDRAVGLHAFLPVGSPAPRSSWRRPEEGAPADAVLPVEGRESATWGKR